MNAISQAPLLIDCRGLQCPAPIMRLAETVRKGRPTGGRITVLASDADFPVDLEAWCRTTKATLLHIGHEQGGVFRAEVQLADARAPGSGPASLPFAPTAQFTPEDATRDTPLSLERTSPSHGVPSVRLLRLPSPARFRAHEQPPSPSRDGAAPTSPEALSQTPLPTAATPAPATARAPSAVRVEAPAAATAEPPAAAMVATPRENRATLLVIRNDLESLLAALMVANSSAAQGMAVEVYFSFWGIHLLRGDSTRPASAERPGLLQRIMLWLVPKGPRQRLGKLHMGGLGTRILLRLMRKRNILALDQLVSAACAQGVRFRVCSMSMGLMGLQQSDIVDLPNIDFAGVTSFSEVASRSAVSLVF